MGAGSNQLSARQPDKSRSMCGRLPRVHCQAARVQAVPKPQAKVDKPGDEPDRPRRASAWCQLWSLEVGRPPLPRPSPLPAASPSTFPIGLPAQTSLRYKHRLRATMPLRITSSRRARRARRSSTLWLASLMRPAAAATRCGRTRPPTAQAAGNIGPITTPRFF